MTLLQEVIDAMVRDLKNISGSVMIAFYSIEIGESAVTLTFAVPALMNGTLLTALEYGNLTATSGMLSTLNFVEI